MECFPTDIEEKLGYDIVRSRLAELAATALGQHEIQHAQPLTGRREVEQRLALVLEWIETVTAGEAVGLGEIVDVREVLSGIGPAGSWISPEEALELAATLRTTRLVKDFFTSSPERFPNAAQVSAELAPNKDLETAIGELISEDGDIRDSASPELRRIRKQIREREARLRKAAEKALREAQAAKYAAGDEPTIRGGRTVIPVKAEAKRRLDGLVVDSSATGHTVFVEPHECIELNNDLRLLEGQERREIVRLLEGLSNDIREVGASLIANQQILAHFDATRAAARLSLELDSRVPSISNSGVVIKNGRNPALTLLRQRSRGPDEDLGVVPLNLSLGEADRVLLISGPNAGGKSVATKTVGLLAMMLAYGLPIPAGDDTEMPLFEKVYVDIGDEQSLETDLSTFSSHLERLKLIVEEANDQTLVLIDELGTATDPVAGAAIAQAVIEHLVDVGAMAVVTTHFGQLKAFADETSGVANGAMMFDRENLSPTYVFEPGVPGSSFAFQIAARTGFPTPIIDRARALAGTDEATLEELLTTLERAKRRAVEYEQTLAGKLEDAEKARQEADDARRRTEESQDRLMAEAEARAEALLKEANRTIENTIREIKEAQAERTRTKTARADVTALQNKIRQRAEKRRQKTRSAKRERADEKARIRAGDQVVLDEGQAVGEVESISGDSAVVTFGSMQTRVEVGRLTKVGGQRRQEVKVGRVSGADTGESLPQARQRIDLRGYRVVQAIPEVDRFVDEAVRAGLRRVEILHGTGTGALRTALTKHLNAMQDVQSISEAPIEQGGPGVTVVTLV